MIHWNCHGCKEPLESPDHTTMQMAKCEKCGRTQRIPYRNLLSQRAKARVFALGFAACQCVRAIDQVNDSWTSEEDYYFSGHLTLIAAALLVLAFFPGLTQGGPPSRVRLPHLIAVVIGVLWSAVFFGLCNAMLMVR